MSPVPFSPSNTAGNSTFLFNKSLSNEEHVSNSRGRSREQRVSREQRGYPGAEGGYRVEKAKQAVREVAGSRKHSIGEDAGSRGEGRGSKATSDGGSSEQRG